MKKKGENTDAIQEDVRKIGDDIKALEEKGYVRRFVDQKDRRNTLVEITKSGQEVLDESNEITNEFIRRVFEKTDKEEMARLVSYIHQQYDLAKEELEKIRLSAPGQVCTQTIDVTREDAPFSLEQLITKMGGMDVFLLSSGIGKQNLSLQPDIELQTAATNVSGFIRMVNAAYHYFEQRGKGHIAVISSIAGTKGLGSAPAYSATKRFQNTYIDALDQLAHMKKLNISFTDIRPGFVATPLLKDDKYPLLMHTSQVASQIVKAISRRKRVAIIDWRYQFIVFFWKLIPGWLWVRLPVRNQ